MAQLCNDIVRKLRAACPALRENVPLSAYTTLKLGGPADFFAEPESEEALKALLAAARDAGLPVFVLGCGSNLLVSDSGYRGLVIRTAGLKALRFDGCRVTAGAGLSLAALAREAAAHDLGSLAFASGIPGSVGGGVLMNAGAYGGELGAWVTAVRGVRPDGSAFAMDRSALDFGYRHSALQGMDAVVTEAELTLQPADGEALRREMTELNRRRAEKQPLGQPSCGSTFKRPEGAFAAALIDQCGLKGLRVGGAAVSEKHAGFLLNLGGTADDYLQLMRRVQQTVLDRTGFHLEPEVRLVGFDETEAG